MGKKQKKSRRIPGRASVGRLTDVGSPAPPASGAAPAAARGNRLADAWWAQTVLIVLAVAVVYGHTLDVPFYMDDFSSIRRNTAVWDLDNIGRLWDFTKLRVVGYFTLALNYSMHGFDVAGYHLVNILIHMLAGIAVLGLIKAILRTPGAARYAGTPVGRWLPLLTAGLFVLHPLQIQAVTYIVQRLASLTALFYIGALALYVFGRTSVQPRTKAILFAGAALLAVTAFFTKQNSVTLPLAVLLVEALFFRDNRRRLLIGGLLVIVGLGAVYLVVAHLFQYDPFSFEAMNVLTATPTEFSRGQYLATQPGVIWTYLRLFVWPAGLHLDHDVPLATGLLEPGVLLALAAHIGLLFLVFRFGRRYSPVVFGIGFYYLALLVESSFIPLNDLLVEHRTYLPNVGLCLVAGFLLLAVVPKWTGSGGAALVSGLLLLSLAAGTWLQNDLWRDPVRFWEHCARHAPGKSRPWHIYGKQLMAAGKPREAVGAFLKASDRSDPNNPNAFTMSEETAVQLVKAFVRLKDFGRAGGVIESTLNKAIEPKNRAQLLDQRGVIHVRRGEIPEAEQDFRDALKLAPGLIETRNNLCEILILKGELEEADQRLRRTLEIDPGDETARILLGRLHGNQPAR